VLILLKNNELIDLRPLVLDAVLEKFLQQDGVG